VVAAALRIMDEEGLEAVTMRRIGRELGVEAMSLYNHVRDKEDILEAVCEAVMAEFDYPEPSPDWEQMIRRGAGSWRRLLKAHPNVITLLSESKHPLTSVEALRPTELAFQILRSAGLSESEAVQAYRVFGGYIIGFVLMEVGSAFAGSAGAVEPRGAELASAAAELPVMAELIPHLLECDPDANFEFGLDLLIEGLRARIGRQIKASSAPTRSKAASASFRSSSE
jgi:AcrR family transcriptional regulator